jgi:ferric-dicitrate binding protein FerR (iron transport regulator)
MPVPRRSWRWSGAASGSVNEICQSGALWVLFNVPELSHLRFDSGELFFKVGHTALRNQRRFAVRAVQSVQVALDALLELPLAGP